MNYFYDTTGKSGELTADNDKEAITRIEARCDLAGVKPVAIYKEENGDLVEIKNYKVPVTV